MMVSDTSLCCWNTSCFPTMTNSYSSISLMIPILSWIVRHIKRKFRSSRLPLLLWLSQQQQLKLLFMHVSHIMLPECHSSLSNLWLCLGIMTFFDIFDTSSEYDYLFPYKWLHTLVPTYCDTSHCIVLEAIFYSVNSH